MSKMSQLHHDSAPDRADHAEAEVRRLTEQVAKLKSVLKEMEWGSLGPAIGSDESHCPCCDYEPFQGHNPNCRLKAALETP